MPYNIIQKIWDKISATRYRWWVLSHDFIMIIAAWLGAYWLRFNLAMIPGEFLSHAIMLMPMVLSVQVITLIVFDAHRGLWRFTSMTDIGRLLKSIVIGTLVIALVIFLYTRLTLVPRSVFVFYALLLTTLLCGSRIIYRYLKDHRLVSKTLNKAMIVGAGNAGEQLVRDLRRIEPRPYNPVAFVDDDASKAGKEIQGIRVVGSTRSIPEIAKRWEIDLILIAIPSASDKQMQEIVDLCEQSEIEFRTLPSAHDVVSGRVGFKELREVQIEDLLGRDPVKLDRRHTREFLDGKTVLVTGAGGSIGSELCRQIANLGVGRLILLERNEYNLYKIEQQLKDTTLDYEVVLGDVCDSAAMNRLFSVYHPNVVYHAAAYKHVPILEGQIREAVKNNIVGTRVVADLANKTECDGFILISTDKAVNPTSLMGACKRVGEVYCQSLSNHSGTEFLTVRFGNVMGSTGSVVPLFKRQIEQGGPVTVTHRDMLRYFMTISEASQLILETSAIGQGGAIYVLDMGKPIEVDFLAREMIKLSGKKPDDDIQIVYTGVRRGEKLTEELFHDEEAHIDTGHDKILLANSRQQKWNDVEHIVNTIHQTIDQFDEPELVDLVMKLVPEFVGDQLVQQLNINDTGYTVK